MSNYVLIGTKRDKRGAAIHRVLVIYDKLPTLPILYDAVAWYKRKYNYTDVQLYMSVKF